MSTAWLAHPEWAPAVLAGILAATLATLAATARSRRRLRRLLGPRAPHDAGGLRDALLVLALAAIGGAALGPRIGERTTLVTSSGVDLVILLDVSRSMNARDVAPSRLARARRAAEEVLARLEPGDRAALAAFAGRGVLLTPLTPDLEALADMLPAIDPDLMRAQGSRLAEGVRAALGAFEAASLRPRVLLVLSDGEDPSPRSARDLGVAEAARAGVRVLAATFGSTAGAPVPDGDVPLRDGEGRTVESRADPARLARLARATGGTLLETDDAGALRVGPAVAALRRDAARVPGEPVARRVTAVQVLPLAALAFVLLGIEAARVWGSRALAPRRVPGRSSTRMHRAAAAAIAALLCAGLGGADGPEPQAATNGPSLAALEAAVQAQPRDPHLLLRLGLARARANRHTDASDAFLEAALYARDAATTALAYYDLGVSRLEAGALESARDAFFDALALDPGDRRAQFNLEWTLRALEARPPTAAHAGGSPPEGGGEEPGRQPPAGGGAGEGAARPGETAAPSQGPGASRARAGEAPGQEATASNGSAQEKAASAARAASGAAAGALRQEVPVLGPDEAQRWLAAAGDDPGRALREAARRAAPAASAGGAGEPTW